MDFNLKKELPTIAIIAIPFIYLAVIYGNLPETIPLHWNIQGEVDGYGNKSTLWIIPFLLPLLTYVLVTFLPAIDPENKFSQMGGKLHRFKFLITLAMSALAVFIIYSAGNTTETSPNLVLVFIGMLYLILGNYFQTIRPNYFIGIKTPWTLESDEVWKSTHKMAGKLWMLGGTAVILFCLLLPDEANFIVFLAITAVIVVVPLVFSYREYGRLKSN
ncbi:MAG: SdpI family protein [Nonlabens sp.]